MNYRNRQRPVTRADLSREIAAATNALLQAANTADLLQFEGVAADLNTMWWEMLRVARSVNEETERVLRRARVRADH